MAKILESVLLAGRKQEKTLKRTPPLHSNIMSSLTRLRRSPRTADNVATTAKVVNNKPTTKIFSISLGGNRTQNDSSAGKSVSDGFPSKPVYQSSSSRNWTGRRQKRERQKRESSERGCCIENLGNAGRTPATCLKIKTQKESARKSYVGGCDKNVAFSFALVHKHKAILGDNPSVSSGPPLTIGWDSMESRLVCIDEFERAKLGRKGIAKAIPKKRREACLLRQGVDRKEIMRVVGEIEQLKAACFAGDE